MNKQKWIDLGRTTGLLNITLFKNPRTYILGILLPIVVSLLLQFLWAKYTFLEITPPEMISFMYVPVILGAFYVGILDNETRENKFQEKINMKVNDKGVVKYAMLILVIELVSINILLTTLVFFTMANSRIMILDSVYKKSLFNNLLPFVWVYYVIFGLLLGLMSGLMFFLIQSFFKRKLYALLSMSTLLIFMLFFSDTVIPSRSISNNNVMTVIGYLNPIKYITWSMNLISSYQFEDFNGIEQIYLKQGSSFEPFNNLCETTIPAVILLIGLIMGYWFKKEKN